MEEADAAEAPVLTQKSQASRKMHVRIFVTSLKGAAAEHCFTTTYYIAFFCALDGG